MRISRAGTAVVEMGRGEVRGPWLLMAHLGWACLTVCTLGLFVAAIPDRYSQLTQLSPGMRTLLANAGLSAGVMAGSTLVLDALYLLGSALIAALILSRTPRDPMGLFVAVFLVSFAAASSATIQALGAYPAAVVTMRTVIAAIGYIGLNGLFFLFPDGRFVPRWTWVLLALAVVGQVPFSLPNSSPYNPNSWQPIFSLPLLIGIFGAAVFAQIYRYVRVSDALQRQQTKWVVYGATAAIVLMFIARAGTDGSLPGQPHSLHDLVAGPLMDLGFFLIPLSIGVSILRYRLWDIDLVINRTLVYGGLTAAVVGLYVLIIGYLGTIFRVGDNLAVSLLGTGAVAVLFQPIRERLQRGVNHLMYGERDEPYVVLSRLGQRLDGTLTPALALSTIVETIAGALKLPYVAITIASGTTQVVVAACGTPSGQEVPLPLMYQADTLGQLILAPRTGERDFSPADRQLLDDLARRAGVAVHAVRLTSDLQRSREQLVTAREEERRRLHRDLHDGLGPTLAGLFQRLDVAEALIPHDPDAAIAVVGDMKGQVKSTIGDIRRLVYALRPPALDEYGLLGAIQDQVSQRSGIDGLSISLTAPECLPPLPAAVEVAAYRIVVEAVTNVARHAHARHCSVRVGVDESMILEVTDDGVGLPPLHRAGVGLMSMRDRAAELGGECSIGANPPHGTRVLARLPIADE